MPTIKRLDRKPPKKRDWKHQKKRELRQKLYQNAQYRKLRDWYMIEHPLCEECLKDDRITPSVHLHHINSPFTDGLLDDERMERLIDTENFIAVCVDCHEKMHGNVKKYANDFPF